MEANAISHSMEEGAEITFRGKILVVGEGTKDLEAYSSSLRQEGFEVRAFVVRVKEGYQVLSSKSKNLGGRCKTLEEAKNRLRQVELFKHKER
jgi:hypothetical protein